MERIGVVAQSGHLSIIEVSDSIKREDLSLEKAKESSFHALLVNPESLDDEMRDWLKENKDTTPIYQLQDFPALQDANDPSIIQESYLKMRKRWTLENNLESVEKIFTLTSKLKTLWNSDRHAFMKSFWYLIKKNTLCSELSILFNDVIEQEEGKPKLIQSIVSGDITCDIQEATEPQKQMLSHYDSEFAKKFSLIENENDVVIAFGLEKSPILLMAPRTTFSALQLSLLKAIINGIESP